MNIERPNTMGATDRCDTNFDIGLTRFGFVKPGQAQSRPVKVGQSNFFPLFLSFVLFAVVPAALFGQGVKLTQTDKSVRVEINGKLFTEYHFKDVPRPYCYPVLGPEELPMTRNWPMRDVPDEEHDHPHHRGLWFAYGNVNGMDFWSEEKNWQKIVHDKFLEVKSGDDVGVIKSRNKWITRDGTTVCTDERTLRFYNRPDNERVLDFEITLIAPKDKPVRFGDTKEGAMATRVAESMRLSHGKKPGSGHIVESTGLRDGAVWGKRAEWADYYGPVNGKTVGVAIFDHPKNPNHPCWWHARDYGLFAANPFGRRGYEGKNAPEGGMTIPAGKSLTFRYRFYFHEGDDKSAKVAEHFAEWAKN
jgi:hypothetical protein